MPRNKAKKVVKREKNESCTPADKLKEQGNENLLKGNYSKAIDLYTQAIQLDNENPIYFCNRATAYFKMENFETSISDAKIAIELDESYIKAHIRLIASLYEVDLLKEAWEACKIAEKIEKNEDLEILLNKIEKEVADENILDKDDPERVIFDTLFDWLNQGNSEYSKLKLRFYSRNYRGVHSSRKIKNKETILFIARSHLITLEMAKATSISKKILENRLDLLSPKHSYLSTFLLLEKRKKESFWTPYLNILPSEYSTMPIFFNDQDLEWLKGSPFLNQVHEKVSDLKKDYEAIRAVSEEFHQFSFKEFCWARMTASSRIFGLMIDGCKTDAFVPLADMLNHRRPKQTSWSYCDERQGFIIESLEDIDKGDQVYDSYGRKCNSRFLLNYGFIVLENDSNEVAIAVNYSKEDPVLKLKQEVLNVNTEQKIFKVLACYDEKNTMEFIGFLRFVMIDDKESILTLSNIFEANKRKENDGPIDTVFKPQKTPPLNLNNERKVLNKMRSLANDILGKYPTTLEEDKELLKRNDLSVNQRNCVLLRSGEKEILHFLVDFANSVLPLTEKSAKEVRKTALTAKYINYSNYLNEVILPLLMKRDAKD